MTWSRIVIRLATPFFLMLIPLLVRADGLVRIASDEWCPYICTSQGKITGGFLVDVAQKSMEMEGYRVDAILMPLNRAMRLTATGDVEGVYAPAIDERLKLSEAIVQSRSCFYTRANDTWTFRGVDLLKNTTLGVIDDYGYDNGPMDAYIAKYAKNHALIEFNFGETAGITNLQKLMGGRYRVMLEHEAVMGYLARTVNADVAIRNAGCLIKTLPLTIGFARRDIRAEKWIAALSEGLKKLKENGEFAALSKQYHIDGSNIDASDIKR